jgi:hypothetical protein
MTYGVLITDVTVTRKFDVSSYKINGTIILIHSSVALHVRDLTRFVVIELDEAVEKFN